MEKAPGKEGVKRRKWYGVRKEAFFPVKQVITDHRADIAFVHAGTMFHDSRKVTGTFSLVCDLGLVWCRDLGIRDNKSRQEGMCVFTFPAQHTHNAHADWSGGCFERTVVIGMYAEAAGVAARACEQMKRKVCYNRVINFTNFFRHRVEIRKKKSYHNFAERHQPLKCVAGTRL